MMAVLGSIRAMRSTSCLPIFERPEVRITTPRLHVRPFGVPDDEVRFGSWRLAHAVKKADCARWPTSGASMLTTIGFLLEYNSLFDWEQRELRLGGGCSDFYADISRTSLAARIAQGLALLVFEDRGYSYVGRLPSVLGPAGMRHASHSLRRLGKTNIRTPDFIFEMATSQRVLVESKGSFVTPGTTPNVKGHLADALDQLDGWDQILSPQPIESFGIGTFLREIDDWSQESSLVALVDPKPRDQQAPFEIPSDAVRRANYGAWLSSMGFTEASRRLISGVGEPQAHEVAVLNLAKRKIALAFPSPVPHQLRLASPLEILIWLRESAVAGMYVDYSGETRFLVSGIDLSCLELLSDVLRRERSEIPDDIARRVTDHNFESSVMSESDSGALQGNLLTDGTFYGELTLKLAQLRELKWQQVVL